MVLVGKQLANKTKKNAGQCGQIKRKTKSSPPGTRTELPLEDVVGPKFGETYVDERFDSGAPEAYLRLLNGFGIFRARRMPYRSLLVIDAMPRPRRP